MNKTTIKELNKRKIYTKEQLNNLTKFKNKFLNVYLLHFELWNNQEHKYNTTYEIRGISTIEKENFQRVEDILK